MPLPGVAAAAGGAAATGILRTILTNVALPVAIGAAVGGIQVNVPKTGPMGSMMSKVVSVAKERGKSKAVKLREFLKEWGDVGEFMWNVSQYIVGITIGPWFVAGLIKSIVMWDFWAKTAGLVDRSTNMLTPEGLDEALQFLVDLAAAVTFISAAVPALGDVADEILESLYENIFNDVFTDSVVSTYQLYAGREAMDDDEIRDVASELVERDPKTIAMIMAQTRMNTLAAVYEYLTGVSQGFGPVARSIASNVDDYYRLLNRTAFVPEFAAVKAVEEAVDDIHDMLTYVGDEARERLKVLDMLERLANRVIYLSVTTPKLDEAVVKYYTDVLDTALGKIGTVRNGALRLAEHLYDMYKSKIMSRASSVSEAVRRVAEWLQDVISYIEDDVDKAVEEWVEQWVNPAVAASWYLYVLRDRQANVKKNVMEVEDFEVKLEI